jgi:hypothetical protein
MEKNEPGQNNTFVGPQVKSNKLFYFNSKITSIKRHDIKKNCLCIVSEYIKLDITTSFVFHLKNHQIYYKDQKLRN